MSFLEINPGLHGFFDDAASSFSAGWGPFSSLTKREERKSEKERLKHNLRSQAQTFSEKRQLTQDEAQALALENFREKVVAKLNQMELEASNATTVILKIRQEAAEPALKGDAILDELGAVLADMEKAVIQIQAGTVIDTATFDTDGLAQSYADAQAGLIAMRAVTARGQSVLKTLKARVQQLAEEAIRVNLLEAQAVEQRAVRVREQRQQELQRQREQEDRTVADQRLAQRDLMARVLEVNRELSREKRRLGALRVELANVQLAAADRAARRAAYA